MDGLPARPRTQDLPADLDLIADRVEERVDALLAAETSRWSSVDPDLVEPLEALRGLVMAGGKRLRPAFCHWGFVAAGGDPRDPRVVQAGAAFELFQAFALIHDDIMDGSAVRRGSPAVHRRFEGDHHHRSWHGEARRFGEGVAILIGDLALIYADMLLPSGPPVLLALWDELRVELNMGQYLDLVGTAAGGVDRAGARRIALLKSGRYTIERPLQLGALLAGGREMANDLSLYGDPLGQAFQLRDDVLGAFGEADRTGKPVGEDLREGKPTLLLAVATETAEGSDAALLEQVGDPDLGPEVIAELQDLLVRSGALGVMEAEIAGLANVAVDALSTISLPDSARIALEDLAEFVVARDG